MKKLNFLFATTVLLGAVSALADGSVLVELKQSPGHSADQRGFDLKVMSSGEVTLMTTAYRLNYVATKSLANLSDDTMAKFQQLVAAIPEDAVMTDVSPDTAQCDDAPISDVTVFKSDKPIEISSKANCREMQVQDSSASKAVSDLMYSLLLAANLEVSN